MAVLVTGGAGYIGSHTCVELLNSGYRVVVIDNLSNSSQKAIGRVERLTGKKIVFYHKDLLDKEAIEDIFKKENISEVIHFAGWKAVGESVLRPMDYYYNNLMGTLILCETMSKYGVKKLIFSSSATVYGNPSRVPIAEGFPLATTSPYGRTKLIIEDMLRDIYISDPEWEIILLRYFNPIGAHKSGLIGESPKGIPNNLVPYITQVAAGKRKQLEIYGNDYNTPDGTGIRDYIHVVDLAIGHLRALEKLEEGMGVLTYNLGTGKGYSVLEVLHTFEQVCGQRIPYIITARRPGDIESCYADATLAKMHLGWEAKRSLVEMCEDAWFWQSNYPNGYDDDK